MRQILITVEESDSSLGFYSLEDYQEIGRVKTGFWPHEITLSNDGATAYVTNFGIKDYDERIGTSGASISVIDIATQCEIKRLYTFRNHAEYEQLRAPHGIKLHPAGDKLYVNLEGPDQEMLVFDLAAGTASPVARFALKMLDKKEPELPGNLHRFDIPTGTHNFLLSPDGDYIFLSTGKTGLYKISATTGTVVGHILADAASPVRGLTYDPAQTHLIVSGVNKISLVDPDTMQVSKEFGQLGVTQILYAQPTPDGRYILAPAVWECVVLVIEVATGTVFKRIGVGVDPIHIAFSTAKNCAYVSHGRTKYIAEIDLTSWALTQKIPTRGGPNGLAIAPYSAPPEKGLLKIGACLPLSGPSATEGREIRLGYQFWEEKTNESGGIYIDGKAYRVEVIFRDTLSKSLGAGDEQYIKDLTLGLIQTEQVDFLFGTYPTPPNIYMAALAHAHKIPFIIATGAGEDIYTKGYDYTYGIMSPAKVYLSGTIAALLEEPSVTDKPQSILFLTCKDTAARADAIATAAFAASKGLQLVDVPAGSGYQKVAAGIYEYDHLEIQFDEFVQHAKAQAPDLFFNTGHLPESIALYQSILDHQFTPKGLAFSVGPTVPAFRSHFGDKALHLFGSAQWNEFIPISGQDEMETPQNYAKAFFERFSAPVSYFSAGGYACGIVLKQAIVAANSTSPAAINQALQQTDLQTFFAAIRFNAGGLNDTKPIVTVQIQDSPQGIRETPLYPPGFSISQPVYPRPHP